MTKCLICDSDLIVESLACKACDTSYTGQFLFSRLARLDLKQRELAESLILHGGNLKEMALSLEISYPTLKKQLNELASALQEKIDRDEKQMEKIFQAIELEEISPQKGIKQIQEIKGEL
jgi:hypothetical protein